MKNPLESRIDRWSYECVKIDLLWITHNISRAFNASHNNKQ